MKKTQRMKNGGPPHGRGEGGASVDNQVERLRRRFDCISTDLELAGRDLKISYKMTNKESLAIKRSFLGKDRIKYFDFAHGYLDMSSLGIDNVQLAACL